MMPPALLANRGFSAAALMVFSLWGSLALCVFLTSQYFQVAQGDSPFTAGLKFAVWPLPVALVPLLAGRRLARSPRRVLIPIGMALHAIGLAGMAVVVSPTVPYPPIALAMAISGIGLGIANALVSAQAMSSPPRQLLGVASGVSNSLRQFGGALGVAIGATVFAAVGGSYSSPSDFSRGFDVALWAAVVIAALGALLSFFGVPRADVPPIASPVRRDPDAAAT
jgi:MFS family permease